MLRIFRQEEKQREVADNLLYDLLHLRPASVFHLGALHLMQVAGRILQHFRICDHLNLKTTRA